MLAQGLSVQKLASYLSHYPSDKKKYLLSGFKHGFSLGSTANIPPRLVQNHSSTFTHCEYFRTKLASEISKSRIKGPYNHQPLKNFICCS